VWKHPLELEAVKYIGRIRSTDDTVVIIIGECDKTSFKASDLNLLEYTIWNKKNDAFKILVQRFGVDLFAGS
jgi:hypothetical protein